MPPTPEDACKWVSEQSALINTFGNLAMKDRTQSQLHIKPCIGTSHLAWLSRVALCPRKSRRGHRFASRSAMAGSQLRSRLRLASGGERTLLGGLKTKNVDVVKSSRKVSGLSCPCRAKGAIGVFRNLTNRMEEAVGDLHELAHHVPGAIVTGYLFVSARA